MHVLWQVWAFQPVQGWWGSELGELWSWLIQVFQAVQW